MIDQVDYKLPDRLLTDSRHAQRKWNFERRNWSRSGGSKWLTKRGSLSIIAVRACTDWSWNVLEALQVCDCSGWIGERKGMEKLAPILKPTCRCCWLNRAAGIESKSFARCTKSTCNFKPDQSKFIKAPQLWYNLLQFEAIKKRLKQKLFDASSSALITTFAARKISPKVGRCLLLLLLLPIIIMADSNPAKDASAEAEAAALLPAGQIQAKCEWKRTESINIIIELCA